MHWIFIYHYRSTSKGGQKEEYALKSENDYLTSGNKEMELRKNIKMLQLYGLFFISLKMTRKYESNFLTKYLI